ncbi:hypothetical protein AB0H37_44355 [Actinomadura sp. NPDC023710]|uniref:HEAT repeat domain-containing protein n=1 Tax=Actinomadura sp. NPDC023710 TaxID=3158219 RepID=UPI0033E14442
MFSGLHDIDWSSMEHAYGSAAEVPDLLLAMRSSDAEERRKALGRFYGAVHHQGDVYPCTAASVPFLFELVEEATTSDRSGIVELLVSIGSEALDHCNVGFGDPVGHVEAVAAVRSRAESLIEFSGDADVRVRRAAIPGLGRSSTTSTGPRRCCAVGCRRSRASSSSG